MKINKVNAELVQEAGHYVTKLLEHKLPGSIEFHTIDHANYVVSKAELIGMNSGLNDDQLNVVKLCAWFHDSGYAYDPENHEKESARIAEKFLTSKGVDDSIIKQVNDCILSTCIPQKPKDLISRVLCDADLCHLSEENYLERIEKMRKEWINLSKEKISKRKFYRLSVTFFQTHQYHTDFAQKELSPIKEHNLQLLQENSVTAEQKNVKQRNYSRGVESMFRLTAGNQIRLSSIADNKSNILISVNSIIMSVIMTVFIARFQEVTIFILPIIILMLFCLVTIVFAILSTRPNISSDIYGNENNQQYPENLLFFGNFYNMELDEYELAMNDLMKNDSSLYAVMILDQYSLGRVLAKKYKLLRIAYNVFMVGIIISVLVFVFSFIRV
jgi:predicted metal-dependent HD superfamily phosphohydrolase